MSLSILSKHRIMPLELGKENPRETSTQMLLEEGWLGKAFVLGPELPRFFHHISVYSEKHTDQQSTKTTKYQLLKKRTASVRGKEGQSIMT